jgi:hypothetical protein
VARRKQHTQDRCVIVVARGAGERGGNMTKGQQDAVGSAGEAVATSVAAKAATARCTTC